MKDFYIGQMMHIHLQFQGQTLYEVVDIKQPCKKCNENDQVSLQVVCNNNVGYNGTQDKFYPYNEYKGIIIKDCEKEMKKIVSQNKLHRFTEKDAIVLKQKLLNNEEN